MTKPTLKFYEWYQHKRDGGYYLATLRVWDGGRSPLEWSGASSTLTMHFQATALSYDGEMSKWGAYDHENVWQPEATTSIRDYSHHHSDNWRPSRWYAARFHDVGVSLRDTDGTNELIKFHRKLVKAVAKYNLPYRFERDDAAIVIAALDAMGYKPVKRGENSTVYESYSPLS